MHKKDPYIRMSLGYFLMDIDKKPRTTKKYLLDFVDEKNAEKYPGIKSLFSEVNQSTFSEPSDDDEDE
jgi:hypothetical protein